MANKKSSQASKTDKKQSKEKKLLYIFLHLPKTGGTTFTQHLRKNSKPEQWTTFNNLKTLSEKEKQKISYISGHETYHGVHKHFPDREPKYIIFIRDPASRRVSQYNHDVSRMDCKEKDKPDFKKWYSSQIKDELCFLLNKKYKGIPGRKAPAFTNSLITKFKVGNSRFLKTLGYKILKLFYSKRNKKQELENSKALLDKCWFIGITENLDKDLDKLFNKLGIKGSWKRYRTAKSNNYNEKTLEIKKTFELDKKTKQMIYKDNPFDLKLYEYSKKLNQEKQ